jgi:tripartite-type tricarboxylate transporter receptor subunit TctC
MKAKSLVCAALLLAPLTLAAMSPADAFPTRPITIIVPYTPGDAPDVIARLIGTKMAERLGQPVVIENRAGASGQIGLNLAAKAPPDGYTLGVGLVTNLSLPQHTFKSLPYNPLKDFAPVALGARNYLALIGRPDAPFKTVAEMIKWAKDNPNKLTIGTTSSGGFPHISFEMLAHMADFKFLNIPYKGGGPIVSDVLGGRLDLGFNAYTTVAPLIEAGRLNLLGITSGERDPRLPHLPPIAEWVKGYESMGWFGFVAPAGTPPEIVKKLNEEINHAMQLPDVQKQMATLGLLTVIETPEYFAEFLKREDEKFGKLIRDIGFQPQ